MSAPILALRNIAVQRDGHCLLSVPSLEVRPGEVLAVIGPNGAGKSTLLRVAGLLERPTSGELSLGGCPVRWDSELLTLRRKTAIVLQDPVLFRGTVAANAALGLRLRGVPPAATSARVTPWLERLGIAHLARRPAPGLSGGEAQRLCLVRALVLEPELLLLDEPFSPLDPLTRDGLLLDLERILRETGVTTVFVTHDREEALRLGDRVAVLIAGQILQCDLPERVFGNPASEAVARFVGIETILPGVVIEEAEGLSRVDAAGFKLEVVGRLAPGERVMVCLRPEDVVLSRRETPLAVTSARNRIEGEVVRVTPLESQVRVVVDCGQPVVALITKSSFRELALREGQAAVVSFKASAAHLIRR